MLLLVCGHPRSGTTLLWQILDSHPDISLTFEQGYLYGLGRTPVEHARWLLRRSASDVAGSISLTLRRDEPEGLLAGRTRRRLVFGLRHAPRLLRHAPERLDARSVEAVVRPLMPPARIVGDKEPGYVFELDRLARVPGVARIVVYRDARDVVSSILQRARTRWRPFRWARQWDTAEKAARSWVRAVEAMERNREDLHAVRYETLVERPGATLEALAARLQVEAGGFTDHMIHDASIGKHRQGLAGDELVTVMEVAGPTLERLGYR